MNGRIQVNAVVAHRPAGLADLHKCADDPMHSMIRTKSEPCPYENTEPWLFASHATREQPDQAPSWSQTCPRTTKLNALVRDIPHQDAPC